MNTTLHTLAKLQVAALPITRIIPLRSEGGENLGPVALPQELHAAIIEVVASANNHELPSFHMFADNG